MPRLHPPPALQEPATDDKPFIFEPANRIAIHALLAAALALLTLIVILGRERRTRGNPLRGAAAVVIGIASMALQVLVIYRLQTALGSPALSLGAGLASVLGGSGLGALLFHQFANAKFWRQCGISATIGVAIFALFSPALAGYCATLSHTSTALIMSTFTLITCLPIGLPFLAAIDSCKTLPGHGEGLVIGCDGIGGIVGATGATALAMTVGFSSVGLLVVACFASFAAFQPPRT